MKTTLIILCSFLILNTGFAQDGILIWSDEFGTDGAPDPAKWGYDLGTNNGWGNNELENYTNNPANVHIANGLLYINAIKSNGTWTSARVKTQNKFNFTYGKIKFRAKLATGTGTWPALWMLAESITTKGWPACGEVDVMEHVGKNPGVVHSTLHTTSSSGNSANTATKTVSTFNTEFHIYEADWTPDQIRFSIDDVPFYTYKPSPKTAANWPFNAPFFVIMNLAIGGNFGGTVDPALTAAEFQIDYVRVYQSFDLYPLTGPTVVAKNQTGITYSIKQLVGATYSWSVPEDAQIVTGSGTSQIVVNWGETDGEVTVHVTLDGENYEKTVLVTQSVKPQGSAFPLQSEEFNMLWNNNPANINLYPFESQRPLRIDYTVAQKNSTPALIGTFPRALDLSEHPVLRVKAKTFNKSKTVSMRMDFVDANGVATTKSPAFDFLPLIDDGEYYKYSFNFKTQNLWSSTTGPVDSKRISKINFYIDYGVSAVTGYDSIWVDSLWVEQEPGEVSRPNRPSHLSGTKSGNIELHWQDRSDNETGFEIFESANLTGPYTSAGIAGANETSAIISSTSSAQYYQVKSLNAAGYSDASNRIAKIDMLVTASDRGLEHITLYPNPTTGNLLVESTSSVGTIKLVDMLGREIFLREVSSHQSKLDLSQFAKGTYFLHILGKNRNDVRKVILQ